MPASEFLGWKLSQDWLCLSWSLLFVACQYAGGTDRRLVECLPGFPQATSSGHAPPGLTLSVAGEQ